MYGSKTPFALRVKNAPKNYLRMIRAEHLRKTFGSLVAVDDVSLELKRGETFGLLGPNGAGKSTTINMLLGILEPDGGTVSLDEEGSASGKSIRSQLGAAPQSLAIYDDLTAEENLAFFAQLYGISGTALKERVDSALELAGLTERRGERVKNYSGGMKRRLNLACALVHEPPALVLDEPTVGVDPQSRNLIFERIEELRSAGRTILYTTHYMEEAARLCDRVAIMDAGRILDVGTVDELISRHGGSSVVRVELLEPPREGCELPGALDGLRLRVDTNEPLEVVQRLMASEIKIATLHIESPDLESVFLNLTGRSLRDQ